MKPISALFLTLLLSVPAFAQEDWSWSNPMPQGNSLYSIDFADEHTGWTVGDYGTILISTDGGDMWSRQMSGTQERFVTVHAFGDGVVYAVGETGAMYKTADGGETWIANNTPFSGIRKAHFLDESRGWMVGENGAIYMTVNAGADWTDQESGTTETLNAVHFSHPDSGIVVGNAGTAVWTADGGSTWTPSSFESVSTGKAAGLSSGVQTNAVASNLTAARAFDGTIAMGGLSGIVAISRDGGMTIKYTNIGVNWHIQDVWVLSRDVIIAYGLNGCIFFTLDGGDTWKPGSHPLGDVLAVFVYFKPHSPPGKVEAQTGLVISEEDFIAVGRNGAIGISTDLGDNWDLKSSGRTHPLYAIHANEHGVWAAGQRGVILFSPNGEPPWQEQPLGSVSHYMQAITFIDANNGWAAGNSGRIYRTSDGGQTWVLQNSGTSETLYSISFVNATTGWATGRVGTILSTSDGGVTWEPQTSGAGGNLLSVAFADSQIGWIVGDGGLILASTDGGLTWSPQENSAAGLRSVTAINATTAVAVGFGVTGSDVFGAIVKTTDGGATWELRDSDTSAALRSVHFQDAATGWAAGSSGTVVRTTDGGETWSLLATPTDRDFYAVGFRSATDGFVAGEGGAILSTTVGGGTTSVENERPKFAALQPVTLSQNYPNPLSNMTEIELEVHVAGRIAVRVYDLTGRLVAVLADRDFAAGYHRFTWDSGGVSSGIYIYRVSRDGFGESRSMIVVR